MTPWVCARPPGAVARTAAGWTVMAVPRARASSSTTVSAATAPVTGSRLEYLIVRGDGPFVMLGMSPVTTCRVPPHAGRPAGRASRVSPASSPLRRTCRRRRRDRGRCRARGARPARRAGMGLCAMTVGDPHRAVTEPAHAGALGCLARSGEVWMRTALRALCVQVAYKRSKGGLPETRETALDLHLLL